MIIYQFLQLIQCYTYATSLTNTVSCQATILEGFGSLQKRRRNSRWITGLSSCHNHFKMPKVPKIELNVTYSHESMLETLFTDSNKLFSHLFHQNTMMLGHSRNAHLDSSRETQLESPLRFDHR